MRITREQLTAITGRQQARSQARWFKNHFGIDVAYDNQGPILTQAAFEALVMKKLGLQVTNDVKPRPQVNLLSKKNTA